MVLTGSMCCQTDFTRLVTKSKQEPWATDLEDLVKKSSSKILLSELLAVPHHALPSEELFDFTDERGVYFGAPSDQVAELSRTIVSPLHRGYELSQFILEVGYAWCRVLGIRYVVGSCDPRHVPMYLKYGARPVKVTPAQLRTVTKRIDGEYVFLLNSYANASCVTFQTTDNLPEPAESHVRNLVPRLKRDREACVCQYAECRKSDYAYLGSDHCPLSAKLRHSNRCDV